MYKKSINAVFFMGNVPKRPYLWWYVYFNLLFLLLVVLIIWIKVRLNIRGMLKCFAYHIWSRILAFLQIELMEVFPFTSTKTDNHSEDFPQILYLKICDCNDFQLCFSALLSCQMSLWEIDELEPIFLWNSTKLVSGS